MSKIVQAVNAMLSVPENITKVVRGGEEYFFLYRNKYKWSIRRDEQEQQHVLWYYPGSETIEQLASLSGREWDGVDMVIYRDVDIGTKEARASFAELYSVVKERLYGISTVLDDIIGDAERGSG